MSSAPGMCQYYPAYTSDAPEDVSTVLHGSGEGSLCTKVHAAPAPPLYTRLTTYAVEGPTLVLYTVWCAASTQPHIFLHRPHLLPRPHSP